MIKSPAALLLFLVMANAVFAQQTGDGQLLAPSSERVMIIPFNPNYYLSDADREIAEVNEKKAHETSAIFRHGLDLSLQAQVRNVFDTYSILYDTASAANADLMQLYSGITYKYQKPFDVGGENHAVEDTHQSDLFGMNQQTEEIPTKKQIKGQEEESGPKEYMNAVLRSPEVLTTFSARYAADYFVFINQFELKTNYATCLDRSANNFQREVLVHYSIYNSAGEQLKGSVLNVVFGSNDNRLDQIIGEYLPQITSGIQRELMGQVMKNPVDSKQ
jgi:hypothetical protein